MKATIDPDILYFPYQLVEHTGMTRNQIAGLRKRGCKFFGKKTTLRWVREAVTKIAAMKACPTPPAHHQSKDASKPYAQADSNDSRAALPVPPKAPPYDIV